MHPCKVQLKATKRNWNRVSGKDHACFNWRIESCAREMDVLGLGLGWAAALTSVCHCTCT